MPIKVGDTLPDATLVAHGEKGPEQVKLSEKLKGRKVVIFGLPGAFTGTCTTAHLPSFIRARDDLGQKGVDEVICLSVNDPFVMKAWSDQTGAADGGITMLGDPEAAFTQAIGMDFSAPPAGLINRSKRYAMLIDDGEVAVLNLEENPGQCDISGGAAMLDAL